MQSFMIDDRLMIDQESTTCYLASVSSPEGSEAGNGQALQLLRHTARGTAVKVGQHHQHLLQQKLHGSVAKLGHMRCQGLQHCQLDLHLHSNMYIIVTPASSS